jgi:hypothetical protein
MQLAGERATAAWLRAQRFAKLPVSAPSIP